MTITLLLAENRRLIALYHKTKDKSIMKQYERNYKALLFWLNEEKQQQKQ